MGLNHGVCDKCGESIEPKDLYAMTKQGGILCVECGEAKSQNVLAWRTAWEPEPDKKRESKK